MLGVLLLFLSIENRQLLSVMLIAFLAGLVCMVLFIAESIKGKRKRDVAQRVEQGGKHGQASYPVVKKLNLKMLGLAFSMALFAYIAHDVWTGRVDSSNAKFFDGRTGEIFSIGSSSQVVFSLVLLIVVVTILVLVLLHLFQKVYQLTCPTCGGNIEIPVGTHACDCPLCKERLIYRDGEFFPSKDMIKEENGKDAL